MMRLKLSAALELFFLFGITLFISCSDEQSQVDLTGQWEGRNTNDATNKSWEFALSLEDYPDSLSGVYSDAHRVVSIRGINFKNNQFGFIIDLYPETVTFFGKLDGNSSISGTWSYSADSNIGSWYLYRTASGFDDVTPEPEATPDESSSNPFSQ